MKMKVYGFKFSSTCQTYSIEDFLSSLNDNSHDIEDFQDTNEQSENINNELGIENRKIYIKHSETYWLGLIISIKNHKKFAKLIKSNNEIRLDVHELNANEHIADFNFFIYNPQNRIGLYQQYHNSCSTRKFCSIMAKNFSIKIIDRIITTRNRLEQQNYSNSRIAQCLRPLRGKLQYEILVNNDDLMTKLEEIDKLKNVTITFSNNHIGRNRNRFLFWENLVETIQYSLNFSQSINTNQAKQKFFQYLSHMTHSHNYEFEKLKVIAMENDREKTYDFFGDITSFDEMIYDDYIPSINLNNFNDDIENNPIIERLKVIYENQNFS